MRARDANCPARRTLFCRDMVSSYSFTVAFGMRTIARGGVYPQPIGNSGAPSLRKTEKGIVASYDNLDVWGGDAFRSGNAAFRPTLKE